MKGGDLRVKGGGLVTKCATGGSARMCLSFVEWRRTRHQLNSIPSTDPALPSGRRYSRLSLTHPSVCNPKSAKCPIFQAFPSMRPKAAPSRAPRSRLITSCTSPASTPATSRSPLRSTSTLSSPTSTAPSSARNVALSADGQNLDAELPDANGDYSTSSMSIEHRLGYLDGQASLFMAYGFPHSTAHAEADGVASVDARIHSQTQLIGPNTAIGKVMTLRLPDSYKL
ncbi:hypothetical protein C8R45DRAFT_930614 [Mycena sanguinolenta]|nr:hypothetical protein C8R45DRAFT_930614 [Mycena sanguinolenta]